MILEGALDIHLWISPEGLDSPRIRCLVWHPVASFAHLNHDQWIYYISDANLSSWIFITHISRSSISVIIESATLKPNVRLSELWNGAIHGISEARRPFSAISRSIGLASLRGKWGGCPLSLQKTETVQYLQALTSLKGEKICRATLAKRCGLVWFGWPGLNFWVTWTFKTPTQLSNLSALKYNHQWKYLAPKNIYEYHNILRCRYTLVTIFSYLFLTHNAHDMTFTWMKLKLVSQGRIPSATRTRNRAHRWSFL